MLLLEITNNSSVFMEILKHSYEIILTAILGYIVWMLQQHRVEMLKQRNAKDAVKEACMLMLKLIIRDMHTKYIEQGYITREGYEFLDEIYDVYHEQLGGNGLGTKMKEELDELEIR